MQRWRGGIKCYSRGEILFYLQFTITIIQNNLFGDAVVVRCEIHIRKNCTDAFGDVNGNKLATVLLYLTSLVIT